MIYMRAAFNTGARGDKLAYHNGMVKGFAVHTWIFQGVAAAHRLMHTASKVKIRHMQPVSFQVFGQRGCHGYHGYPGQYPWSWQPDSDTARLVKLADAPVPLEGFLALSMS